ncbi:hypothetical protein HAX54_040169, partial [Datura stramonium]|nr:hypothetical protein [Datura stramonium]
MSELQNIAESASIFNLEARVTGHVRPKIPARNNVVDNLELAAINNLVLYGSGFYLVYIYLYRGCQLKPRDCGLRDRNKQQLLLRVKPDV